ncbi:MAG TPA: DUF2127 domain-containing protein [Tepidisphaeraceae bacterium]|nr:DUF2127 domain-containing protein [Tepidisphaeraceae bacterium]
MATKERSTWVLVFIGAGKLLKASLLLIIAVEAHRLIRQNLPDTIVHWAHALRIEPDNAHLHKLLSRVTGISPRRLRAISIGTFFYAALFATEGVGLVLRKRWAEFLTVISTALLLPVEAYEIFHGYHRAVKIIVLLLNAAVLVYLIVRLREDHNDRLRSRHSDAPTQTR